MEQGKRKRIEKTFGLLKDKREKTAQQCEQKEQQLSIPVKDGSVSRRKSVAALAQSSPTKRRRLQRTPLQERPYQVTPDRNELDFDDDDSVCDKTYDPLIGGDLSSSDSENEFKQRVNKVKKKLFCTSVKKSVKKLKPEKHLLKKTTSPIRKISHQNRKSINIPLQSNNEDLITPQDLGFNDNILTLPKNSSNDPSIEISHTSPDQCPTSPTQTIENNVQSLSSPQMNGTRTVEDSSTKKNPRKRKRNVDKWIRVQTKKRRLQGLPYHSSVAKKNPEIKARELKPPCSEKCRKKCTEKLSEENRKVLFHEFWSDSESWDQRRQYIVNNIQVMLKKYVKTTSSIENDRRKYTHTYYFPSKNGPIPVCKTMFINTLNISAKFIRVCISKKLDSGLTLPDQRGLHVPGNKTPEHVIQSVISHISSYPSYESHYNREKTARKYLGPELNLTIMYEQYVEKMEENNADKKDVAKNWLYREIFNTKFSLSFKMLELDTCDECDKFHRLIKDCKNEDEKQKIIEERNKHFEEAGQRYKLKKGDKENCYENNNTRVLFLDLQKCLPTPYLTNTSYFYLRKLWTLNLTIYEAREKKASNFVWPEFTAGRGGNEVSSCLIKWAEQNLGDNTITETITWTDNCQGQNRNMMLVMTYFWLMHTYPHVNTMMHKFLLKGHTHMEVDHIHSIIERKKKHLATMEIAVPRDWAQFLRSCSGKNAFQVTEMLQKDFTDVSTLAKKGSGPFIVRKKNTSQEDFKISETVLWRFERNKPGILLYKTDFNQTQYKELNLTRKVGTSLQFPENLPLIRNTPKPIATTKFYDLMTLLQWVPSDFHDFYKNLVHSDNASEIPEVDKFFMLLLPWIFFLILCVESCV